MTICVKQQKYFSKILNRNLTSISGFFNLVSASGNVEGSEDDIDNSEQGPHGLGLGECLNVQTPQTLTSYTQGILCKFGEKKLDKKLFMIVDVW